MYRDIDDDLSPNNSKLGEHVDHIYPIYLEIKNTTDADKSASLLDLCNLTRPVITNDLNITNNTTS